MIRLYINQPLQDGASLSLGKDQTHYLFHVMRRSAGDSIRVFNGCDGEWNTTIADISKRSCILSIETQYAPQRDMPDLWLVFSPIKKNRLDFMIEKATELGATKLFPTTMDHSDTPRFNTDKQRAHCIEAAEQCERMSIPGIEPLVPLAQLLEQWDKTVTLIACCERGQSKCLPKIIQTLEKRAPLAILIGPEGGFSEKEIALFDHYDFMTKASLGDNILRAETAAITALSVVSLLRKQPRRTQ